MTTKTALNEETAAVLERAKSKGVILRGFDKRRVRDIKIGSWGDLFEMKIMSRRGTAESYKDDPNGYYTCGLFPYDKTWDEYLKKDPPEYLKERNCTFPDPDEPDDAFLSKEELRQFYYLKEHTEEEVQATDFTLAEAALDHYNNNLNCTSRDGDNVKYSLTETLGSLQFFEGYHCNFLARPVDDDCCADSSPKLFFAEVRPRRPRTDGYEVLQCCILDEGEDNSGSKVVLGCINCRYNGKDLAHPAGLFQAWSGLAKKQRSAEH